MNEYIPNEYTLRARIMPALITLLPILLPGIFVLTIFPTISGLFITLLVSSGVVMLLGQIARDAGKKIEDTLYKVWGGKPTLVMLSLTKTPDTQFTKHIHRRLYKVAQKHKLEIPTLNDEVNHPQDANHVYERLTDMLREHTRDRVQFPLVFEEVCNYGFRRNLLGLKNTAISIAIFMLFTAMLSTMFINTLTSIMLSVLYLLILANSILLLVWLLLIDSAWVKRAAYTYARQLLISYSIST
jgi:hypothetical protein